MRFARVILLALAVLVSLSATIAVAKPVTIGVLEPLGRPGSSSPPPLLITALRNRGFEEGRNLTIVYRSAMGRNEELPRLAAELVSLKPDVIFAWTTPAARAAKAATSTIPIVMAGVGDPVAVGLVPSLARPGGNMTGPSNGAGEVAVKRLQLITETLPGVRGITYLTNPTNPGNAYFIPLRLAAAKSLGIELDIIKIATPDELDQVLGGPLVDRFRTALDLSADALFATRRRQIADAALRLRMSAFGPFRDDAVAGFLMSYGVNAADDYAAAAVYIDRILKGASPADLPIELPTKFHLVINLRTASALGFTIPQAILARANEVIE